MSRFLITKRANGAFMFRFVAGSGRLIFHSIDFADKEAVVKEVEFFKKAPLIASSFNKSNGSDNKIYFTVRNYKGQTIGVSGGYTSEEERDADIKLIIRSARSAPVTNISGNASNIAELRLQHINMDSGTSDTYDQVLELQSEISMLRKKFQEDIIKYEDAKARAEDKMQELEELKKLINEINVKSELANIIPRVNHDAAELLLKDPKFRERFSNSANVTSVVVSIDIRRSTELMLKAKTPRDYSLFITSLSNSLSAAIIKNFGIFDKFTGDGILAFFPDFYSGKDALIHAIRASEECHEIFNVHYNNNRDKFNVFIKNIGLGIGIDFGEVTLVNNESELTVVGVPVVYACRMSGAPANTTILNQSAYDHLIGLCGDYVHVEEKEIEIKHEGTAAAYAVEFNRRGMQPPSLPDWIGLRDEDVEQDGILVDGAQPAKDETEPVVEKTSPKAKRKAVDVDANQQLNN